MSNNVGILVLKVQDRYVLDVVCNLDIVADFIRNNKTEKLQKLVGQMQNRGHVLQNASREAALQLAETMKLDFIKEMDDFPEFDIAEMFLV